MNVVSQSNLLYKSNAFFILINHLCTVALNFAVSGGAAEQVQMAFSFFPITWIEDMFLP